MPMNFTTLTGAKSLTGSILSFVNYNKVPAEVVLEEAQALIYSNLRVREMRVSGTHTLVEDAATIDLPARFLEPIALRDRTGIRLIPNYSEDCETFLGEAALLQKRGYDEDDELFAGIPAFVAIFDEKYQFDVKADADRAYDHIFYQAPALLAQTSNETNFLTVRYPHLLRIACLAGAASFMKDDAEEQKQTTKLAALIAAANAESDLSRAS